jgi:hypothetical protein
MPTNKYDRSPTSTSVDSSLVQIELLDYLPVLDRLPFDLFVYTVYLSDAIAITVCLRAVALPLPWLMLPSHLTSRV